MAKIEIEINTVQTQGDYVPEYRSVLSLRAPGQDARVFYSTSVYTGTGAAEQSQQEAVSKLGRALGRLIEMIRDGV